MPSMRLALPPIHSMLHSNSIPSGIFPEACHSMEYLHSICHYLSLFIWLLVVCLTY